MIRTIDLRGGMPDAGALEAALPRALQDVESVLPVAAELVDAVRERGAAALAEQAERFDGGAPPALRVPAEEIDAARDALDPAVRAGLAAMAERVSAASAAQVPEPRRTSFGDGAVVEQRWVPVRRAGLYAPGGKAAYPSSLVMNVAAARAAGVGSLALASPPQRAHDGRVHPVVLGAAGVLGVDEVWAMGGAGAIGAFAWGVPEVGLQRVDVVAGPGNAFVAAAKRVVRGRVGTDAEAGTTEILVIADQDADPDLVVADLVSQAEHDEAAAAVLVTWSVELADAVRIGLADRAPRTANAARVTAALDGPQSAIVLVDDADVAVAVANAYAPEHLEVQTADADTLVPRLVAAGAVFVGPHSPVSLGDYLAGSNHILPTGGTARFSAGLSAASFLKPQQVVRYDRDGLAAVADAVRALADAESLPAHGDAVAARFPRGG